MNTDCDMKIRKIIKIVFWVLAVGVFMFFILGELLLPANNGLDDARCNEMTSEWYQVRGGKTFSLPYQFMTPRGQKISISTILPDDIRDDDNLVIRSSKQEMSVYIDGKLRKTYSTLGDGPVGNTSVVAYVFVGVDKEDSGKELTITVSTKSAYSGLFKPVYIGNWLGILGMFIGQSWLEVVVSLLTIIMGIVCIIGGILLALLWKKPGELEYLGFGAVFAGVWLITNIAFRQGIFPNISVLNDIPYYMLMLMPMAFVLYFNGIQGYRYQKFYMVLSGFLIADFLGCTLLHIFGVVDFADSIYVMAFFGVMTVASMVGAVVIDFKNGFVKEYSGVVYGLLCALLTAVVQLFVYFNRTVQFNGLILALGLLILLVVSSITTVKNVIHIDREKNDAIIASESKAQFLAQMSHEIRTPINAVLGMNSIILRESKEPETLEYARDIRGAGQSLLSIINDILDFSKIESGHLELSPARYDLSDVIRDVVNMVSEKVREKNLKLDLSVDSGVPTGLYGDEIRVKQILVNLLNNAVKYTPEGSVKLSMTYTFDEEGTKELERKGLLIVEPEERPKWSIILHVSVEDTGIGIKKEDMKKLFAAFERLDEEKNKGVEGTGLGMTITLQLLRAMDSDLKVESKYGVGSKFMFDLKQLVYNYDPIGDIHEKIASRSMEPIHQAGFRAPDAQILVVDDNDVNRKVFKSLLKPVGMMIDESADGADCLEKIYDKHYDIIFLDHMMPGMSGIETLKYIRKKTYHKCQDTPIVVLTANAIHGAREKYLEEGFDDYLSKPIIPGKLEEMVRKLLPSDMVIPVSADSPADGSGESGTTSEKGIRRDHTDEPQSHIELPELTGVNWEHALLYMPDEEMLLDTLKTYYIGMDKSHAELQGYLDGVNADGEGSLSSFRTKVHAMKSESALIGIYQLSGVAAMLERAAIDEDVDIVLSVTPVFLKTWDRYRDELGKFFESGIGDGTSDDASDRPLLDDTEMIADTIQKIVDALDDLDADTADGYMDELNSYRYTEDMQKLIDKLSAAVTGLDGEAAREILEQIIQP